VVTGAGSGLGRTFAKAFAGAGAKVVAIDIFEDRAEETSEQIGAEGGEAAAIAGDVSDPGAVRAMAEEIARAHGEIHVLVNNAGITVPPNRIHELPVEEWNEVVAVNLNGVFLCTRALIPLMLQAGGGSIINISSIAGLVGLYPGLSIMNVAYSATKAAVIGLTRQTAAEYAMDKIRVNAIAPGWHGGTRLGERSRRNLSNEHISRFEDAIVGGTPMGRRAVPDELSGLVIYLASDASSFMTGQVFANDGGWTAI
jgi:NAD(P)-dependent dehydrogenase (short-subunit alcohol dehydrogenase family)